MLRTHFGTTVNAQNKQQLDELIADFISDLTNDRSKVTIASIDPNPDTVTFDKDSGISFILNFAIEEKNK